MRSLRNYDAALYQQENIMPIKGLYVIINPATQKQKSLLQFAKQILQGGADALQFRDKGPITPEMIEVAHEICTLCKDFQIPFILNDHVHIAKQIQADGVHIGQNDTDPKTAREILGENTFIGVTISNSQQAKKAALDGADYLGCGHIYPTTTKQKALPPIGLSGLKQVVDAVSIPVIAIGGITYEKIPSILSSGAAAIAVVSAIEKHPDPEKACKEIKNLIKTLCIQKS